MSLIARIPHDPPASGRHGIALSERQLVGLWMSVLVLAMRCKLGEPDTEQLARVSRMAVHLPEGDPVRAEVADVARRWTELRLAWRHGDLVRAGDALMRAIERATWPDPVGRADLYG